jgi:nucleoside-diphosphate-sugar epimerase
VFLLNLDNTKFEDLCSGRFTQSSALSAQHCVPLINIGCGEDQTISSLANLVARVVEFRGEVYWDGTKPDGTPRKLLDISRLTALGWSPRVDLETGTRTTYEWYLNQFNLPGIA